VRDRAAPAAVEEPQSAALVGAALLRGTRVSFGFECACCTSQPADRDQRPPLPACAYRVTNLMNDRIQALINDWRLAQS
jgi:hypothetical protein